MTDRADRADRAGPGPRLRALHHGPGPLVLPNVWDAASARACADAGFPAVATASAAVAASLGFPDGQQAPTDVVLAAVSRVAAAVHVPVSADMEAGLGLEPAALVDRLLAAGVAGLNIEDSDPATGRLRDGAAAAATVAALRAAAGDALVINARIDVFLPGADRPATPEAAQAEARDRARQYVDAGADVIYPILAPRPALVDLIAAVDVPVNALCAPDPQDVRALTALGVRRVTFGGSLLTVAMDALTARVGSLARQL